VALPFFTVGHSNRPIEDFTALLAQVDVGFVADIRKVPASRANPQFNQGPLSDALRARGVAYEAMAALGGLRGKARGVLSGVNGFWTNDSFHNYADYALSPDFHAALDHLIERGRRQRCAMMCSEAVWWRCHRRIVADHLIARGETVLHILGRGQVEPARLTPGAVVQPDGAVAYPA
jgi:uncharacterized protein (DUF488 family)